MTPPLTEVRGLARRLLAARSGARTAEADVETLERVLRPLAERISPLVGTAGFQLLLSRALRRTQHRHPWLHAVRAGGGAGQQLSGWREAAPEVGTEPFAAAAEDVVAELIGLLARFLGADMAARLVRQAFPEIGSGTGAAGLEEMNDG